ncbi:MAG: class I SAM-dependent methyltransferase [Patescibacteria group bacterium]|jgi:hypothetical protein
MTNYLKKIYKKIFPDWTIYLQRAAKGCDSLLDLACGYNSLAQFLDVKHKVGVEMFEDYLRQSREKGIHDEYFQDNILTIEFPPRSYDLVLASEIIEHLDKADGFTLLDNAERWAKKKVVIATPNGYIKQDSYDDNPLQIHKSGWSIEEFKQRGYRVNGIGGLKFIRGERGEYKYKPYALWRLINDIGQKIVYHFPRLAFQLIAVKDIK